MAAHPPIRPAHRTRALHLLLLAVIIAVVARHAAAESATVGAFATARAGLPRAPERAACHDDNTSSTCGSHAEARCGAAAAAAAAAASASTCTPGHDRCAATVAASASAGTAADADAGVQTLVPPIQLTDAAARALLDKSGRRLYDAVRRAGEQQALNLCGPTALTVGLRMLGLRVSGEDGAPRRPTVDAVLAAAGMTLHSAIGDGVTLAELHDAAARVARRAGLDLALRAAHCDAGLHVTADDLAAFLRDSQTRAARRDGDGDDDGDGPVAEALLLNFHTGIAHAWSDPRAGGGHFSLFAGVYDAADGPRALVCDVNTKRYGPVWSIGVPQLLAAVAGRDSEGRARGVLRLRLRPRKQRGSGTETEMDADAAADSVDDDNPLNRDSLLDWATGSRAFPTAALRPFVPAAQWDAGLGAKNLAGASAVAAALRALLGTDAGALGEVDGVVAAAGASVTGLLNGYMRAADVAELGGRATVGAGVRFDVVDVPGDATGLATLLARLLARNGAEMQHGKKIETARVAVLVSLDVNRLGRGDVLPSEAGTEAGVLSHGSRTWAVVAAAADGDVAVASGSDVLNLGRVWPVRADVLRGALTEARVVVASRR